MASEDISSGLDEAKESLAASAPASESTQKEMQEEAVPAQEKQAASRAESQQERKDEPSEHEIQASEANNHGQQVGSKGAESELKHVEDETSDERTAPLPKTLPSGSLQQPQMPDWRKGSTVSFKDVAELFEIDLEASKGAERPAAVFSLRFYIMILALMSPFVVTFSKVIINFAITEMIEPAYLHAKSETPNSALQQSTSAPFGSNATTIIGTTSIKSPQYFDLDNSCPVDETNRERLLEQMADERKQAGDGESVRFQWGSVKQGFVKAAYSIGHMLLQVLGGRLSEIHGSHLIMGSCAALIGLSCLSAPFLASASFYLLFVDLFLLGILGSFMTPALITLFSNWLTPNEKSIMFSFYLISSRLGYALSALLCGLLIEARLPWSYLFYAPGWVALAFSILFYICARSRPHEHPLMRAPELDYLASKNTLVREAIATSKRKAHGMTEMKPSAVKMDDINGRPIGVTAIGNEATRKAERNGTEAVAEKDTQQEGAQGERMNSKRAPWAAILTNSAVWAFIITKFCVKLAGDTVQIELPVYLKRVMHLGGRHNGFINAANYVIFCASCLLVGWLARLANKRHPFGWTKTTVRKVFQCTASCGVGLSLLGIAYFVCNETLTMIMLMSLFFFTTFGTGGEAQIPLDISERYSGTIHAIGSQLAISGAIEPILVGFVLRGSQADRDRWVAVWLGASCVAFLGGLVFALFGDATIQPFDKIKLHKEETSSKRTKMEGEAPQKTGVELRGHVNGSFQMKEELAASQKIDTPQRAEAQSEGI